MHLQTLTHFERNLAVKGLLWSNSWMRHVTLNLWLSLERCELDDPKTLNTGPRTHCTDCRACKTPNAKDKWTGFWYLVLAILCTAGQRNEQKWLAWLPDCLTDQGNFFANYVLVTKTLSYQNGKFSTLSCFLKFAWFSKSAHLAHLFNRIYILFDHFSIQNLLKVLLQRHLLTYEWNSWNLQTLNQRRIIFFFSCIFYMWIKKNRKYKFMTLKKGKMYQILLVFLQHIFTKLTCKGFQSTNAHARFCYYYTLTMNSLSIFWLAERIQWIFKISACDSI